MAFFAIPGIPGSFGNFEYGVEFAVVDILAKNTSSSEIFSFGIILHLCSYVPYTVLGLIYFLKYYTFDKTNENYNLES